MLRTVDALVANLLTDLPDTCTLLVTADHGMIQADSLVNLDALPALQQGVRIIAGEARVRQVYLARGTTSMMWRRAGRPRSVTTRPSSLVSRPWTRTGSGRRRPIR
ncbi:hypothetical protein MTP03_16420 [Tsukamurella sp. PLM1]|nr:hypothetical protein MTP03_16420 [Tsukamurella sp. PLM1]